MSMLQELSRRATRSSIPTSKPRRTRRSPGIEPLEPRALFAVQLQVDYSLDTGFFADTSRRALLESTLNAIASQLGDTLSAVAELEYTAPSGGRSTSIRTSVPANTLKIYVYGAALPGNTSAMGGSSFVEPANHGGMRGQGGTYDFAPNVSFLRFDNDGSTNWYFGATSSGMPPSQFDFVSCVRHEFIHALGMQRQPTFDRYVDGDLFRGPRATTANKGSSVPLSGPGEAHIAAWLPSVMNATILTGTRRDLGAIEWGILADLGWTITTPPGFYRGWDLLTNGSEGWVDLKVVPSRGVYLMQLDALAGDTLELRTRNGSTASEQGVDTYLKLFDEQGNLLAWDDDSGGSLKSFLRWTFSHGGRYYVGAGTYAQRSYTLTTPPTVTAPSTAFWLKATLTDTEDREPNNIRGVTSPVDFSGGVFDYTTTLGRNDGADYFAIDALAGHSYTVMTYPPVGGGFPGTAIATILDATGRKVAGTDPGASFGQTSFIAPMTARYFVLVAGYTADEIDPDAGSLDSGWHTITASGEYSAGGGGTYGRDYAIRITDTPPPPPPPATTTIDSVRTRMRGGGVSGVVITFSGKLVPSTARKLTTYLFRGAGDDRKFGTKDDIRMRPISVKYDSRTKSIRLTLPRVLHTRKLRVEVNGSRLRDARGLLVDGDRDNQPGGKYYRTIR